MLNEIGKALRILRINKNITAQEMAEKIGISPTYLSAIENGKRNIPQNFFELISGAFTLSIAESNQLRNAITKSMSRIQLDFSDMDHEQKEVLLAISQKKLDKSTIEQLNVIIHKNESYDSKHSDK